MTLKLKNKYLDAKISCPFTGVLVYLKFLDTAMYIHYYNKGLTHLFDKEKPSKITNDISI